jgi:ribonuclease-3
MPQYTNKELRKIYKAIGYNFKDGTLLERALTHTSYVNEQGLPRAESNQRLEYLGDAVIELVITETLYELLPEKEEGALSSIRSSLVRTKGLAQVAVGMGLGEYLILGVGADKTNERENPTVLEDAFEALAGAVFLDGGYKKAYKFVYNAMEVSVLNALEDVQGGRRYWDRKTALQVELQKNGPVKIIYRLTGEEGPQHERTFFVDVCLRNKVIGSGSGSSKKEAEQNAAGAALEGLNVSKKNRNPRV